MFKIFGKTEKIMSSPSDGEVIPLEKVPDPVFSGKMLGEGFAVIPSGNAVFSPVDGTVVDVTDTLHAYCITTPDELDVLVHIGINTVELNGEGFSPKVSKGDTVHAGDILCEFDSALLTEKGYNIHTPVIVTNTESLKTFSVLSGTKKKGDPCMKYTI